MARKTTIQRHRLIISKLRRTPCTFDELQDFLRRESEYTEEDLTCSIRTFQRDMKTIASLYSIEISCDRSRNVYSIVHDGSEEHNERLLEAFEIYNALDLSNNFARQVILEKRKALGTENLYGFLHAIKGRREVAFKYRSFYDDTVTNRRVQPVAIKEARNRWYLLGKDTKDGVFKSFGLDRIEQLEISNHKFEPLKDYDPQVEYRYAFGIINGTGEKPQQVELAFTPREGRYVQSLPLHHSQQLVKKTEKETIFRYYIIPTYDFKMELLSYGDQVRVLKPDSLKKQLIAQLESALAGYK